jgi:hypothetical protein
MKNSEQLRELRQHFEVRYGLLQVGVAYTATYNGTGEFYSGLTNGEEVILTRPNYWTVFAQSLEHRGANLSLYDLKNITNIKKYSENSLDKI